MRNKRILTIVMVMVVLTAAISVYAEEKKERHITIPVPPWSGNTITAYSVKKLLEEDLGYTVTIVKLGTSAMWAALSTGDVSIWLSAWMPNQASLVNKYKNSVTNLGFSYEGCEQGIMTNKWVAEKYSIKQMSDLNRPELAKEYDIDGDGIGDVLGCDVVFPCAKIIDDMLQAYNLAPAYKQVKGAEEMLMVTAESRLQRNKPVLFQLFVPDPLLAKYSLGKDLVFIKDPKKFLPMCSTYKFANNDWVAKNPEAVWYLRHIRWEVKDIAKGMALFKKYGDDPAIVEKMVNEWLVENKPMREIAKVASTF